MTKDQEAEIASDLTDALAETLEDEKSALIEQPINQSLSTIAKEASAVALRSDSADYVYSAHARAGSELRSIESQIRQLRRRREDSVDDLMAEHDAAVRSAEWEINKLHKAIADLSDKLAKAAESLHNLHLEKQSNLAASDKKFEEEFAVLKAQHELALKHVEGLENIRGGIDSAEPAVNFSDALASWKPEPSKAKPEPVAVEEPEIKGEG